jgi:hypothetical protein
MRCTVRNTPYQIRQTKEGPANYPWCVRGSPTLPHVVLLGRPPGKLYLIQLQTARHEREQLPAARCDLGWAGAARDRRWEVVSDAVPLVQQQCPCSGRRWKAGCGGAGKDQEAEPRCLSAAPQPRRLGRGGERLRRSHLLLPLRCCSSCWC